MLDNHKHCAERLKDTTALLIRIHEILELKTPVTEQVLKQSIDDIEKCVVKNREIIKSIPESCA